jgi:elongation factor G
VFAGASFRNIGVQPLLDAILDLLPSPIERGDPEITLAGVKGNLGTLLAGGVPTSVVPAAKKLSLKALAANIETCALAFKVVNDPRRGVLVYVRVYSGSLKQGSHLYNTTLGLAERAPRLLRMYASEATDVPSIEKGHIGVIVGLKHTRTGDTLVSYNGMHPKNGPPEPFRSLQLRPIAVPPPVFFTSIEPISQSEEKQVSAALQLLLREDPSLSVSTDLESGQTLLSGMGELHLEIARERLIQDFKAKATAGKIEIGYREAVSATSSDCLATVDREVAGKYVRANCVASVQPRIKLDEDVVDGGEHTRSILLPDENLFTVYHPSLTSNGEPLDEAVALPTHLTLDSIITAMRAGTSAALARGPEYSFPMHSTNIKIYLDQSSQFFPNTTLGSIAMATRQAVQAAIKASCQTTVSALMEPVMLATITVHEEDLGQVVQDITSARGGQVLSLGDDVLDTSNAALIPGSSDDHLILDPKKAYAPMDPFSSSNSGDDVQFGGHRTRQITARVPLREMVGYLKHLRSLTGGRGTFVMQVDRFDRVSGQRLKRAVNEIKGL